MSLLLLLLAIRELLRHPERLTLRLIAGRILFASSLGLVTAFVLISRTGQMIPSGWRWLVSILLAVCLPPALVLGLAAWHRLHDWIPDAAAAGRLLREGVAQGLSTTRNWLTHAGSALINWLRKLRHHGPAKKES